MNGFNDLFSGGSRSAFNKNSIQGETVTGPIVSAVQRQVTDFVTKQPETWDNGDPKMQAVITIKTDQRIDDNDDGARSIYVKTWGLDKISLIQAVQEAGFGSDVNAALAAGNIFTATFTGTQPSKFGSDQKLYAYRIQKAGNLGKLAGAIPTPVAAPAVAPQYAQQTPSPVQAPPAAPASTDVPAMIAAGWSDEQIAQATGADPKVIAAARNLL